jgi:hypothetical protein
MELNAGAMMKPVHQSQPLITRRAALAASGAGVAALWLPESVHAQHESPRETDLRRILSGMTLADKVGQLLMAYLEPQTLAEKIDRYRCGSLLVWGNLQGVDVRGLCDLTNRAQTLSLERRKLPLWLHGHSQGLGWRPGWLRHAARVATPVDAEKAAELFGRRWRAVGLHNLPEPTLNVPLYGTGIMPANARRRGDCGVRLSLHHQRRNGDARQGLRPPPEGCGGWTSLAAATR